MMLLNANAITRYAFAVICVTVAWAVRWLLDPYIGGLQPFSTFFVATAAVAWWVGWRVSVVAALLGFLAADWFFIAPRGSLNFGLRGWIDFFTYSFVSGTAIWLMRWVRGRERYANAVIERENVEHALREAKEQEQTRRIQLETLLEAVPVPVWIGHDSECGFLIGNPAAYHVLELPLGANLSMSAPVADRPQIQFLSAGRVLIPEELPIQKAARFGEPILGDELEIRFSDGRSKWILGNAVPLRDASGAIQGAVGAFMDITERKQMEERLREAKEMLSRVNNDLEGVVKERTARLQETVNELEYFSYSITHDMRAPLRAMQGFSELLVNDQCFNCPNSQAKEYLHRIMAAAVRMDALIVDALSYSKLGQGDLLIEPVDVAVLLRGILETYPNLQAHCDAINLEGSFPVVLGNKAALTQCFSNLLGNAIKFADPARKPQIRVWAETVNDSVRLWFEDNGIGVPPEWQERIFEMFQRVNAGDQGTGIGLALVRKAVQKMGGQVGVESEPGKGSRFWLKLTLAGKQSWQVAYHEKVN